MKEVDETQLQAISHGTGPMLVTAGPGSGKTTVITYRIYHLIHSLGISPEQILVITFTKAAAKQMQERYRTLNESESGGVTFATFHALFYAIVREENAFEHIRVLNESEKRTIMSSILKRNGFAYPQAEMIEELLRQISFIRNQNIDLSKYQPIYFDKSLFLTIYCAYEKYVKSIGKVDFDDMMLECRILLKNNPLILKRWQERFRFYLIDEFQDINPLQYDILMLLAEKEQNIFCVGDEDQAIYGFRGASPKLMFDFLSTYKNACHILMTRNYRSESQIIEASNRLIKINKERFSKEVKPVKIGEKDAIQLSCFDDASSQYQKIADEISLYLKDGKHEEISVLFRTNRIPQEFIEVMYKNDIKLKLKTEFLTLSDEEITKDIYAYLMLAQGDNHADLLRRIMNKPIRYLSKDIFYSDIFTWDELMIRTSGRQYCKDGLLQIKTQLQFIKNLPLYAAVQFIRKGIGYERYALEKAGEKKEHVLSLMEEIHCSVKNYDTPQEWMEHLASLKEIQKLNNSTEGDSIDVLTMHAAKGLEWPFVIIPDVVDGNYPFHRAKTKEALEEERRIFYVGMTRAKHKLLITSINNPVTEKKPSVYFNELLI